MPIPSHLTIVTKTSIAITIIIAITIYNCPPMAYIFPLLAATAGEARAQLIGGISSHLKDNSGACFQQMFLKHVKSFFYFHWCRQLSNYHCVCDNCLDFSFQEMAFITEVMYFCVRWLFSLVCDEAIFLSRLQHLIVPKKTNNYHS